MNSNKKSQSLNEQDASAQDVHNIHEENTETESANEGTDRLKQLEEELSKAKNENLYLRADFDNYRKQVIKERSELMKYGSERLVVGLLDVLDIFDQALQAEVSQDSFQSYVEGVKLTASEFRKTLEKFGVVEAPSDIGTPFDPMVHEAISSEPTDAVQPGHISRVFKKAYKLHDKLIRPAQVSVARAAEKPVSE